LRFAGKVAFVTGAGSGIGRAIALRLASEGAKVNVTDLDVDWAQRTVAEVVKNGGSAQAFRLDVTVAKEVDEVVERVWGGYGGVELLVNNAGVSTMNRLVDLTERDWDFNMDVNAKGVFLVTQAVVRRMLKVTSGPENRKIVNVASMAGKVPATFLVHYTASKLSSAMKCQER